MEFESLKRCLIGLYGQDIIIGEERPSLLIYFNADIPVLGTEARTVKSVKITAGEFRVIDDPTVTRTEQQIAIPQIRKYFPASITIQFKGFVNIISPILNQLAFIESMKKMYPVILTLSVLIAKASNEAEMNRIRSLQEDEKLRIRNINQITINSIRINQVLLSQLISKAIQTSKDTPGCDVALVGRETFLREVRDKVYREMLTISDTIEF